MEISQEVETKLGDDHELLELLKAANPDTQIERRISISFDIPAAPEGNLTRSQQDAYFESVRLVGKAAGNAFSAIEGMKINHLRQSLAMASISGTAEAVVKAIELNAVKSAHLGDRVDFRPELSFGNRVKEEHKDKGPPQVGG